VRASRDTRNVYEEHLQIVDAIGNNLPDEAERLMRLHMAEARKMIEQQAARNDFTSKWAAEADE
jgi:DNA-binding GntR family transcriptional regulator